MSPSTSPKRIAWPSESASLGLRPRRRRDRAGRRSPQRRRAASDAAPVQRRPRDGGSAQDLEHGAGPRGEVHGRVVLRVPLALHVEHPHRLRTRPGTVPSARCRGAARSTRAAGAGTPGPVSRCAGSEKSTAAGATATTESTFSGMSVWVCVSWRYITAQTAPRSVCSTSSGRVADHVHVHVAPEELVGVACASRGSVSSTGIQPNGAHAAAVSGPGSSTIERTAPTARPLRSTTDGLVSISRRYRRAGPGCAGSRARVGSRRTPGVRRRARHWAAARATR